MKIYIAVWFRVKRMSLSPTGSAEVQKVVASSPKRLAEASQNYY
jgi:hypothetical protein